MFSAKNGNYLYLKLCPNPKVSSHQDGDSLDCFQKLYPPASKVLSVLAVDGSIVCVDGPHEDLAKWVIVTTSGANGAKCRADLWRFRHQTDVRVDIEVKGAIVSGAAVSSSGRYVAILSDEAIEIFEFVVQDPSRDPGGASLGYAYAYSATKRKVKKMTSGRSISDR